MLSSNYIELLALCNKLSTNTSKGNKTLQLYWQIGHQLHVGQLALGSTDIRQFLYATHLKVVQNSDLPITTSQLRMYCRFYHSFPDWRCAEAELSWSHYQRLIRLKDVEKRNFYRQEAIQYQWTTTTLNRQIKALYYERQRLWTPHLQQTNSIEEPHPVKDHYILEFLRLPSISAPLERELEDALLEQLQNFLLELGNGFSFVARQKMVTTATGKHFFIDLVFYHFELKCFVLIDLKVGELSHRDIGQMDMYVRLYEEKWRRPDDNPTIGIILCSEKDQTIVKYSLLSEHRYLYASTYQLKE